jgi:hypothetical protein
MSSTSTLSFKPISGTNPPSYTITTSFPPADTPKKGDPIFDLLQQVFLYGCDIYEKSATLQARARGKNSYYSIKKKRQYIHFLCTSLFKPRPATRLPQLLNALEETTEYLLRFAKSGSNFAKFAEEHRDDLRAFDAALRLIEAGKPIPGEQKVWWKPLPSQTNHMMRFQIQRIAKRR